MKKKVVNFKGRALEVREMTIGVALPIISRLSGDDATDAQLEMLSASTFENGDPVDCTTLPFSFFSELLQAALEVNGFALGED